MLLCMVHRFLKKFLQEVVKPGDIICISSQVGKASKGLKDGTTT